MIMEISWEEAINILINGDTFPDDIVCEMTEEEIKAMFDMEHCPQCRKDYLDYLATRE